MPYVIQLSDSVRDRLRKMIKKDSVNYKRLEKVFLQLAENPYGVGKWMRGEYAMVRERHVGHFVLKYVINEKTKVVSIVDYSHHE
jgi:mRNA-degrading endonuclease RelE of RelBE toxin-antitoxin system